MTSMLQKVAKGIAGEEGFRTKVGVNAYLPHARSAVMALREPEQAQLDAIARMTAGPGPDGYVTSEQARERWAVLIDTLLT